MRKDLYSEMNEEEKHWWFIGRRFIIRNILKAFISQKVGKALDVGCGTGTNTLMLRDFANQVVGLDSNKEALSFAKKRNPDLIPVLASFPEGFNESGKFDLITMFDVLEHIEDDGRVLGKISYYLSDGGVVILTVPALPILWTEHDQMFGHRRRYRKKQLADLIKQNTSLRIERLSYFNSLLLPLIFLVRVFKRIFSFQTGQSDFFKIPKGLNALLTALFSCEGHLLRHFNFPAGSSLVCVLKKYE